MKKTYLKRKCRNCRYYHKADAEHGSDGCYYWYYGSVYGLNCYKTESVLRWIPLIISVVAFIIALCRLI